MNKIKVYKCNLYEHVFLTYPHKDSQHDWKNYWHEKKTKQGNYVYRCSICNYIKKRNKERNEKTLPDDYVYFKLMGKPASPDDIKSVPKILLETKRLSMRLKFLSTKPVINCPYHGKLFVYKNQVVKAGKDKTGLQKYKCRQCLKMFRDIHYQNNKEKIRAKQKIYKESKKETK